MSDGSNKKARRKARAAQREAESSASGVAPAAAAEQTPAATHGLQTASLPFSPSRANWLLALALVALTVLAYQHAWNAGYIWDDDMYVTENELLTAPDGLWRIWFSLDSPSQYFPLVYTTFRFEHAIWGLHPAGYHWVNILLHAANALLVWRLLRLLNVPGAWLAAALFALHPVHVESVAWITERKNTLMGLFYLLTLLAWVKFIAAREGQRWRLYVFGLVFYMLALFSKTTACTIPAALLLILWLRHERINWARVRQVVPFVVLGLIMGLVTVWWERHHQGTQGELFAIALPERILVANRALWFYLGKLIWPADLAFSYPTWDISAADPADYLWVGLTVAAAAAIYFARRSLGRSVEVALVFFASQLSPMLGFIMLYTFRYTFVADHYQYIASIGPLALVAAGATIAIRSLDRNKAVVATVVCGAVLLALAVRTWMQCRIYENEETLWRATIAVNPSSWMAHNNLAVKLAHSGRIEEALGFYEQALAIKPDYAEAHFNFGNALVRLGRSEDAVGRYRRALELFPAFAAAHTNLAGLLLERGRITEAVEHSRRALEIGPPSPALHRQHAEALLRAGRVNEALEQLKRAVDLDPDDAASANELGQLLARLGRSDEALAQLRRALTLDPNLAAAHANIGNLLAELGQTTEGMQHLERALAIEPQNAAAHYNLANAHGRSRDLDAAIRHYTRAVEINPAYAAAHNNLANTYAERGDLEQAVTHYRHAIDARPDYSSAHANLSRALRQLGRYDESLVHLQKAAEIDQQQRRDR